MCGIAGLIRSAGLGSADFSLAQSLQARLCHRGPDASGIAYTSHAALIQTRLALVDPTHSPLPFQSPGGRHFLVYNGEIYNHRELHRELAGTYPFRTRTDTEVVLAALLRWGPAALSRFEGMFALFYWDNDNLTGLAAVDPLSVKPLLYHAGDKMFAFCSEAAPLIKLGILPFVPNEEAIAEYLTAPYFSSSHLLPFANLQRLLPGHYLELADGRIDSARYRQNTTLPAALLPALRSAVESHASADAKVGLFLSGGVDSSLLAALAPSPLPAFTIDYDHAPADFQNSLIVNSDDVPFARHVAGLYRHPHTVVKTSNFAAALERTLQTNDLIAAWEQEVSQNLLAEAAAPHVKAVLVGDAADETHYGYSFLLHPERLRSPQELLTFFGLLPTRVPAAHFVDKYKAFTEAQGHNWRTPNDQRLAMTCLIRHFWLTRLLHNGDIHLMAHSVEGRVPFADPAVLAFGDNLGADEALRDGIEKHHLRAAAAQVLPHAIAWRPKSALTKHLAARQIIHDRFRQAWRRHGALIERYVHADQIDALPPPSNDLESGLRFRLLSLLTWSARFAEAV